MRTINRVLVKLKPRESIYGIALRDTKDITKMQTKGGIIVPKTATEFSPENYVPTEGVVEVSSMKEVKAGDTIHMEYFGVIIQMGKFWNPGAEGDARNMVLKEGENGEKIVSVFVPNRYVYYIENSPGKIKMVNDYNIAEPIYQNPNRMLLMEAVKTNMAHITHGEYAGKTVVFHAHADMSQTAHKRTVIQSKWIEAISKRDKIYPLGDRILVKPDKPRILDPISGLEIPKMARKLPNVGTVLRIGDGVAKGQLSKGDRVYYQMNRGAPRATVVMDVDHKVCLLFEMKNVLAKEE